LLCHVTIDNLAWLQGVWIF
jgi:hypothetical protein